MSTTFQFPTVFSHRSRTDTRAAAPVDVVHTSVTGGKIPALHSSRTAPAMERFKLVINKLITREFLEHDVPHTVLFHMQPVNHSDAVPPISSNLILIFPASEG